MLTAAACLALVGTASAAWVYAGTATASANVGVKVAAYASAGTITVNNANNVYVYLDNGKVSYKLADEFKVFSATYVKPTDVDTSSKTVTKYFTVAISKVLAQYVTFENTSKAKEAGDGSVYYELTQDDVLTWTDGDNLLEVLPNLAWVSEKCPTGTTAESDYISLINALCGDGTLTSLDDTNKNTEWNVTEKNPECYVSIQLFARVN